MRIYRKLQSPMTSHFTAIHRECEPMSTPLPHVPAATTEGSNLHKNL